MKARDIMTAEVVTVAPDAPVERIASLLLENRISALPVVDSERRVVGIVSEGDLMRRPESGTERLRSWWLRTFTDSDTLAADYAKSHGRRARDVMTRHVVSVTEDTDVRDIAALLESHRVKRVPVVRQGRLVGIVSRADLLKALTAARAAPAAGTPDDRSLHDAITERIRAEAWAAPIILNVVVTRGEVELWGFVSSEEQRNAIRVLVEDVPGVRGVRDNLSAMPSWAFAD